MTRPAWRPRCAAGAPLVNQGEHDQARVHLQAALELFRAVPQPWGVAITQYNLGWLTFYRDDADSASGSWDEAWPRSGKPATVGASPSRSAR